MGRLSEVPPRTLPSATFNANADWVDVDAELRVGRAGANMNSQR
jgi:hypothetical protein